MAPTPRENKRKGETNIATQANRASRTVHMDTSSWRRLDEAAWFNAASRTTNQKMKRITSAPPSQWTMRQTTRCS